VRALVAAVAAFAAASALALPSSAARKLIDEVVAVVDAHSITLSEVQAETRIRLVESQGKAAAYLPLDRRLLAASLRKTIEERVVMAEVDRLKLFDLERSEVDALIARLRSRFGSEAEWDAFEKSIGLTIGEVGGVLTRELRVARYLDNRLKLSAQLRDRELSESASGTSMTAAEREALRDKLAREKYQRLLADLLADLRKRASVRVLDPLDQEPGVTLGKGG
jgi:hypothetical protein